MNGQVSDFVLFGSTLFARLLAGLLAAGHGRQVVLVGQARSPYQLPRGADLSVAPITRPESWAMLRDGVPVLLKLLGRIAGRGAWSHADPIFFSDDPAAMEALSHMRHMALDFGMTAEQTPPSLLGPGRMGILLRDAIWLDQALLDPRLDAWLDTSGVRQLVPENVEIGDDGRAVLRAQGMHFEGQAILADDAAILAHLPRSLWPDLLLAHRAGTVLTLFKRPLAGAVMHEIHSGLTLMQRGQGVIAATGPRDMSDIAGSVRRLSGEDGQAELAGQTSFTALATRDGAPALGRIGGTGPDIIAGMGLAGAFMAPALARWLCNEASEAEAAWFGARLVSRASARSPVAEYAPRIGEKGV